MSGKMSDNMRRKDREITEKSEIMDFLSSQQIMRVAFSDNNDVYIVPLNYGYTMAEDKLTFWFHGAKAGRKYSLAEKKPAVGFEIDGNYRLVEGEKACNYSAEYMSVIGNGVLSIVEDSAEKITGLSAIMKQTTGRDNWEFAPERVNAAAVFRLDVTKMSCKSRKPVHNG